MIRIIQRISSLLGNCLLKETNKVSPEEMSVISPKITGNTRGVHNKLQHELEMERQLRESGVEPLVTVGSVGFTITVKDGTKPTPSRLENQIKQQMEKLVVPEEEYSLEDKDLMADILRSNKLVEKTQQARRRDDRIMSARRRRETSLQARREIVESKPSAADVEKRRENLRKLATATKAASQKKSIAYKNRG